VSGAQSFIVLHLIGGVFIRPMNNLSAQALRSVFSVFPLSAAT